MKNIILAALVFVATSSNAQSVEQTAHRVAGALTHTTLPNVPAATPSLPTNGPVVGVAIVSTDGPQQFDPYTGAVLPETTYKHGKYEPKLPAHTCDISDPGFNDCLAANQSRLVNMSGVVEAHHEAIINGHLWIVN